MSPPLNRLARHYAEAFLRVVPLQHVVDPSQVRHHVGYDSNSVKHPVSDEVFVDTSAFYAVLDADDAVHALFKDLLPVVTVVAIDEAHHTNAVATLLGVNRRNLSLVDCSSFAMMHQRGITAAFAYDRHFAQQGFRLISSTAGG